MPHGGPFGGVHCAHLAHPPVVGGAQAQVSDGELARAYRNGSHSQTGRVECGTGVVLALINSAAVDVVPVQGDGGGIHGGVVGRRYQCQCSRRVETPGCAPRGGVDGGVFAHPPVVGLAKTQRLGELNFAGAYGHVAGGKFRRVEVGTEVVLVFVVVAIVDVVPV